MDHIIWFTLINLQPNSTYILLGSCVSYSTKISTTNHWNESMKDSVTMNWKSENSDQKSQAMSFWWIFQLSTKCRMWFSMTNCSCFRFCIVGKSISYTSIKIRSSLQESFAKLKSGMESANT